MSSFQKITSIENGRKSTGTRTEARNAASPKSGRTAQTVLLPGEDEAAYRKLCAETFKNWNPAKEQERALVQTLCDTQWRIHRCARLEAAILSEETPDFKALDVLSKHEARLKKRYSAALKEVRNLTESIP